MMDCKEAIMAVFKALPHLSVTGLRSESGPPKYEAAMLLTQPRLRVTQRNVETVTEIYDTIIYSIMEIICCSSAVLPAWRSFHE
jgi:hypothetical protein